MIEMISRRKTREIRVGKLGIGGSNPIVIQSMNNTDTHDVKATVKQILDLEEAGCEMTRLAILDMEAAEAVRAIKKDTNIPICADIHFDYRLALKCADNGIDKLRINPGNIQGEDNVTAVVKKAKDCGIPIRIGINGGSLEKDLLEKHGGKATPKGAVESASRHIKILEENDFYDTAVSIKFSDVMRTVEANRLFSKRFDYPLHLGVTEAGTITTGTIKSSVGIGAMLLEGIGDTIRVSLSAPPVEEIRVAKEILRDLELKKGGAFLTACPTCGRTKIDLIGLANEVEKRAAKIKYPVHIAVMGCVVNGLGEGREADVGLCGGIGTATIMRKGEVVNVVPEKQAVEALFAEVDKFIEERKKAGDRDYLS